MSDLLTHPWPWYVAGPLIGAFAPALLLLGNRVFGVSANLRHMCTLVAPNGKYLHYDWRVGSWNLAFAAGILVGGVIAGFVFANPQPIAIAEATRQSLTAIGVREFAGLVPADVFNWPQLLTARGIALIVGGGFLIGFGTAYAGGCTSGHGISGIADLQPASLVALLGFFAGGIAGTFLLLPLLV
jgi:uncharacterized membrane protein YedE/YeeE